MIETQTDLTVKKLFIEKIIREPLSFTDDDFIELVSINSAEELNFKDLREMIIRIFDINEDSLKLQSDATVGLLGRLNKRSTRIRHKRYYKSIDGGFRAKKDGNKRVIVAEGDSWFQFPIFIKDIIDWLSDESRYAVYSIAYGGDWFTNILYDEKYIEELSIHRPEVFLISGGGNDFVGSNRLAAMVSGAKDCPLRKLSRLQQDLIQQENDPQAFENEIMQGYQYILPSFYSFCWTIKAQYYKLFKRLKDSRKFDHMKIITQGYDYVIPTYKIRTKKWFSLQPLVNQFAGSGKWLMRPMMIQGIDDGNARRCIMKALIFEINCIFIDLATHHGFANVYHIDCRGTATCDEDWWDEIHLHSEGYQRIARAYEYCIDNELSKKVVRVTDLK